MRIPSGVIDQYIYFVAVDATDLSTREVGLSGFTVYRSRNGGAAVAYTTPTVNETDSTNMPGVYELLLDEDMDISAGNDSEEVCLHITASGMAPVTRTFELYRRTVTSGNTLGVASDGDISGNLDGTVATVTNVTTVNGLAANVVTETSIAADAITAAKVAADVHAEAADAVWDEDATGHQTGGTFGQAIGDPGANTETIYDAVVTDATGTNIAVDIVAIKSETASILTDTAEIGVAGAGLTNINLPDQTMNITGDITGNLSGSVGSVTGAVGSVVGNVGGNVTGTIGGLTSAALADFFDTNSGTTYASAVSGSVVKEIADNAGGSSLTAGEIADAVWDEPTLGHNTADTFGYLLQTEISTNGIQDIKFRLPTALESGMMVCYLNQAGPGSIGDTAISSTALSEISDNIWDEVTSGHVTAGTFGKLAADILEDTSTTLDTKINTVDTVVNSIKIQTDKLTFTVANQIDSNIQYVNNVQVNGTGSPGNEWGP